MTEYALIRQIQVAATKGGCRLFRVNTGNAWTGSKVRHVGNDVILTDARPVRMGLTSGGCDLIGWTADGRFLAAEAKVGRTATTEEQLRFIEAVRKAGGVAGIVRSVEEFEGMLR